MNFIILKFKNIFYSYALVDFGLAQNYDKSMENIFDYEKLNKSRSLNENVPNRKNMIAISSKKSSSHLILTAPKSTKLEVSSLPHGPINEKSQINSSKSIDINSNDKFKKVTSPTVSTQKFDSAKPNLSSLQKYYSFQKTSFTDKCSCFNMPIVCEICTARYLKYFKFLFKIKFLN